MFNINFDLLTFFLTSVFLFGIGIFFLYRAFNSIELCMAFSSILLSIYVLTILPGAKVIQAYTGIVFSFFYSFYIIFKINLSKIVKVPVSRFISPNLIILIFFIFFLISVFVVNLQDLKSIYGISKISILIICPLFYCYYFPEVYSNKPVIIIFLLKFVILLGFITGIFGIIFQILGYNILPGASNASLSFMRHPNTVAFIYSFSAPVTLYLILFEKNRLSSVQRILTWISLLIIYYGMLITLSRSGYLAIFASSIILLYSYNKKIFFVFLILFLLAFSAFFQIFVLAKGTGSSVSRVGLIYSAIEMLKSSNIGLLWGFGTISVFEIFSDFKIQLGPLLDDVDYPHNAILFFIMQFGIFSLGAILIYFFNILHKANRILKNDFKNTKFLLLPKAIVISIFIQSLLEDTILFPDFFVFHLFLTFFGFLVYYLRKTELKEFPNTLKMEY